MSKITYAIYDGDIKEGGVYNVLASFSRGLLKGFKEAGFSAFTYQECIDKNINFDVAIGFNSAGNQHWDNVLNSNKISVFWNVDSIFQKNTVVPCAYHKRKNFLALSVAPSDVNCAQVYLPELNYAYMPHGVDKDLWQKQDVKKEHDVVFLASVYDYEAKLESLKTLPNGNFIHSLVVELVDMWMKKPNLSFFELYSIVNTSCNLNLDLDDFAELYSIVGMIVEQKQKIQMIQSLSNLNVKVFGSQLWQKYIKGNVQYLGQIDVNDSIDVINKSKIVLHCQLPQLNYGLHERFLNAACAGTFCLTSDTPSIKAQFEDNFGYFNHATFENIENLANYYLQNEDERENKANNAAQIVHQKHLWKHRAIETNGLFG